MIVVSFKTDDMKVMKFGGTSVGSAMRIKSVAKLVCDGQQNVVVLSAMSGTTNKLVEISGYLYKQNTTGALEVVNQLEMSYERVVGELLEQEENRMACSLYLKSCFDLIRSYSNQIFTLKEEKIVLAQGELMSTYLFHIYLREQGVASALLPALEIVKTDRNGDPDYGYIAEQMQKQLAEHADVNIWITQGFICRNYYGEIDNLLRGGSDYTASILGSVLKVKEIEIWTDIDGMHNNDPRVIDGTQPVPRLHFDEAAELAYFGAKILHPTCVLPAKLNNIPVRLLNTMDPDAPGTLISNKMQYGKIQAVAAKDNITAIKIKSSRKLMSHGFLRKIFEIFELYQTPIDIVTTSEVGVTVTIENLKHLDEIVDDLKHLGTVSIDIDMVIICVVGDMASENVGFQAKVIDALREVPVRLISYGGSNYNVSFVVKAEDKRLALESLSKELF